MTTSVWVTVSNGDDFYFEDAVVTWGGAILTLNEAGVCYQFPLSSVVLVETSANDEQEIKNEEA